MDSDSDIDTVIANELRLLDPDVRRDDDAVRALLHDDFREIGTSGAEWDRHSVTRATRTDTGERITPEDLRPARLGPDAILLTYTARRGHSGSLRTSVWVRSEGERRMFHHQGTPAPAPSHHPRLLQSRD